eukprot:GSMAST32.ASY1.ANO1.2661.1 assembled CDS
MSENSYEFDENSISSKSAIHVSDLEDGLERLKIEQKENEADANFIVSDSDFSALEELLSDNDHLNSNSDDDNHLNSDSNDHYLNSNSDDNHLNNSNNSNKDHYLNDKSNKDHNLNDKSNKDYNLNDNSNDTIDCQNNINDINSNSPKSPLNLIKLGVINRKLYDKLFPHQRDGVLWIWKHWLKCPLIKDGGGGGVLADEMGLGKTVQTSVFIDMYIFISISKLFFFSVLIVLPKSVLEHWRSTVTKWCPTNPLRVVFHGQKKKREMSLNNVVRFGGICFTTYGMLHRNESLYWDLIVLDEAQRVKNPDSLAARALFNIPSRFRLLLTGTPIQNNLMEGWALFAQAGISLGAAGLKTDAEQFCKRRAEFLLIELRSLLEPFILRRLKANVRFHYEFRIYFFFVRNF